MPGSIALRSVIGRAPDLESVTLVKDTMLYVVQCFAERETEVQ